MKIINLDGLLKNHRLDGKMCTGILWTGAISSDLVDEQLVEDEAKRNDLRNAIIKLEEALKILREQPTNKEYHEVWDKCIKRIEEILQSSGINLELYIVYLINHYRRIQVENPEEFEKVDPKSKAQMEENIQIAIETKLLEKYMVVRELDWVETMLVDDKDLRHDENREKFEQFMKLVEKYLVSDDITAGVEETKKREEMLTKIGGTLIDFNVDLENLLKISWLRQIFLRTLRVNILLRLRIY